MTEASDIYPKLPESDDNSRSPNQNFIRRVLIVIGLVVLSALILGLLWYGAEVILLVFAGFLLAVFLRSLSDLLSKYTPLSENWTLTIVLLAIVGLIALGVWVLSDSMQMQFTELTEQLPVAFEKMLGQVSQYPLGRRIVEQMPSAQQMVGGRQASNVFGRITGLFSTGFDIVANILIVLMTAVYFAYSSKLYNEGIVQLVPKIREKRAREILTTMETTLRSFLLGISGSMANNGFLTCLGLWFLDIPFAIPLGIIAGLMSFIPNIGPLIASVPAILIALAQSPTQALYVIVLYLAVQNLDGFIISPLIQQRAVSVPPVLVISAQLLLAVMFGFLGLLLAVPIVAVVFVAVKMIYVEDILDRKIEVKGEPEAKKEVKKEVESEASDNG